MKEITYFLNGKKKKTNAKLMDTPWKKFCGLMFKKNSPPLLFVFNKNKRLTIHSFFCKPFKAVWIDDKFKVTKITDVKRWKLSISGKGKYLLEIPLQYNSKNPVEKTLSVIETFK